MRSEGVPDDNGDPLLAKAVVAGLAAALAAALAAGMADGVPAGRPRGQVASGPEPRAAAVADGRGPALPPVPRLCFSGPRGEPVDFPVALHCPQAGAP